MSSKTVKGASKTSKSETSATPEKFVTFKKPSKKRKNPIERTQEESTKKKFKNSKKDETPESENAPILSQISKTNWQKFENALKQDKVDEVTKKVNACSARMHGFEVFDIHFLSLPFLRLAIVDSLLNRNWDNLLILVVRLSKNYIDPVFRMLIRHLCQILKHNHPAIKGTENEGLIDLIVEKYEKKSETTLNLRNIV